jgi:diguanylate cyclase (GGDEF)-like protein/PAS domain S-box-containing protein
MMPAGQTSSDAPTKELVPVRASLMTPLRVTCVVLAACLASSYALWRNAEDNLARESRSRFDASSSLVLAGIQRRADDYQTLVLGMQGLFIASQHVDRPEFRRYYENLRGQMPLPGIRALHLTRRVSDSEKAAFMAAVRDDRSLDAKGFPDFVIHPDSAESEHFVIDYIEPLANNLSAFGLDVSSQPAVRESLLAARETGKTTFTQPFQLVQSAQGERGLVLRAPVYRRDAPLGSAAERHSALVALVGISLDASDILSDIFAQPFLAGLCAAVHDVGPQATNGNPAPARQLIVERCTGDATAENRDRGLSSTALIAAGGRFWEVRVSAGDAWVSRQQGGQIPALVLAASVAVSLLLAALYLALARARTRAERLAAEMTIDLRRSEKRFRALVEMSEDWFWEQDSEGRFVSIAGTSERGAGKVPLALDEIKGRTRWELAPSGLTPAQWEAHRAQLAAREPFELEYRMLDGEGNEHWSKVFGRPNYDEDGVFLGYYGTAHDVTASKQAEGEMARKTKVLQATLENISQGISVVDDELHMTALNSRFCQILGFPEEMARSGASFETFVRYNVEHGEYGPCDADAKVREMVERARAMQPHRFKRTRPNGTVIEVVGNPLPGGGFVTTYTDVTEHELAAQAIRASEARLKKAELVSGSGNWEYHLDFQVMLASDGAAKLYGLDRSKPGYDDYSVFKEIPLPEYRPVLDAAMTQLIKSGQPYDLEFKIKKADTGEIRDIHSIAFFDKEERIVFGVIRDITERKVAEETLRRTEERFSTAFHFSPLAASIARSDDGRFIDANRAYERDFGWKREDLIGRTSIEVGLWPNEEARRPWVAALQRSGRVVGWETTWRLKNGEVRWISLSAESVDMDGVPCNLVFVMDITDRKRVDEALHLAASVFTHAREGIMITDAGGVIVDVNDAFAWITGYTREDAVGQKPSILRSGRHDAEFYAAMWRALTADGYWNGEIWNRRKDGRVYAEMLTISAVQDPGGRTMNYVALFSDITAMKEYQQRLESIAHYDSLTNLPNRTLLADRLQQTMAQSQRRGQSLAVVYLDLDGFKSINDEYGHDVGDQVLITLARCMKEVLRDCDTLARIGGDEFVAVLGDLDAPESCEPVLARLLLAASEPVNAGDATLRVSASIGVTFYPQDNADADQLLRHADQAMYAAKQMGRNRYHLFDIAHDAVLTTRHESIEHIRRALDRREFELYYQPKVNMRTGAVVGAEALIRWRHPERGLLPPGDFLPIIEEHPISVELGEWVIDAALNQITQWNAAGLDISVSVNVGARQLQQVDFTQCLAEMLAAHPQVRFGQLELEIVETSALEDVTKVSELMYACLAMGVNFALDDFGTGYSSLTYLKRLPADLLKVDQTFVRGMLEDSNDLAIVQGIVGLARAFRRQIIAEGVETAAHGALLLSLGCELGQGYGIARPMPAADLPGWAAAWRPDSTW